MKKIVLVAVVAGIALGIVSCGASTKDNPFFAQWDTPFEIPPFEKIYTKHFMPAIKYGMKQEKKEIETIVKNTQDPTFENVIIPYTTSGEFLGRVLSVFNNLCSAQITDSLIEVQNQVSPLLTRHSNDIVLNDRLFEKIKAVYDKKDYLTLDAEQRRLLEKVYKNFMMNGARLSDRNKKILKAYNEELARLSLEFGNNLRKEMSRFRMVVHEKKDLSGLPVSVVEAAAEKAKSQGLDGKWVFTLDKSSMLPFLQYADNQELRKTLYEGYLHRCNNNDEYDNKEVLSAIVNLRVRRAHILGYPSHASYVLDRTMAKNEKNAYGVLEDLWFAAIYRAEKEMEEMAAIKQKENHGEVIELWDWWYYAEKVRKEQYDLDQESLRPYFSLENVRQGIFTLVDTLFGVTFRPVENAPVYHPDCQTFEAIDADGSHLGVLIMDFHPRDGKRVGAWCSSFRSQRYRDGKRVDPIATIVCNFTPATASAPSLLSLEEVETFFHEFGHALHGLFSDVKYDGLRGVSRDFVELPSQIMENWCLDEQVLPLYAKHYQTGAVIPDELIAKITKSKHFNQGFNTVEYLAAAALDLDYHSLSDTTSIDVDKFEQEATTARMIPTSIAPRYRSTYFQHIFSGGYSSGYYSYIWSEMLDADAYEAFVETGNIFDKQTADRFRKTILERGGSQDEEVMYKDFRGRGADIKYLLRNRGLAAANE